MDFQENSGLSRMLEQSVEHNLDELLVMAESGRYSTNRINSCIGRKHKLDYVYPTGKQEQITLLEGDATEILPQLEGQFDMIFMDAAKGQYINFMPQVLRLLKTGGVLVSDNVLQDGDIIESHYIVERRNRTIYKRMREYLYELTHSDELVTAVMPIGDGITVSTKL